jgi:hypothetical protein
MVSGGNRPDDFPGKGSEILLVVKGKEHDLGVFGEEFFDGPVRPALSGSGKGSKDEASLPEASYGPEGEKVRFPRTGPDEDELHHRYPLGTMRTSPKL